MKLDLVRFDQLKSDDTQARYLFSVERSLALKHRDSLDNRVPNCMNGSQHESISPITIIDIVAIIFCGTIFLQKLEFLLMK